MARGAIAARRRRELGRTARVFRVREVLVDVLRVVEMDRARAGVRIAGAELWMTGGKVGERFAVAGGARAIGYARQFHFGALMLCVAARTRHLRRRALLHLHEIVSVQRVARKTVA